MKNSVPAKPRQTAEDYEETNCHGFFVQMPWFFLIKTIQNNIDLEYIEKMVFYVMCFM